MPRLVWVGAVAALLMGCAGKQRETEAPEPAPRTVIAEPGEYDGVVVDAPHREPGADGVLGYETLTNGERVTVVEYVHTYPDPVETYPQVYWSGRWYYNVQGDFVYWDPFWGTWVYYWGPPAPLVACWNGYYPWAPYYWGVGYYGAGWYWGGVGVYGYHAYGLAVVDVHHHHHDHWAHHHPQGGGAAGPSVPPDPTPGGGADGPVRTGRTTPNPEGPVRDGGRAGDAPPADGPVRVAGGDAKGGDAPTRTADAGRDGSPSRTADAGRDGSPTRTADPSASAARTPVRSGDGLARRYTTAGGQRVTVIDPAAARRDAAARGEPTRTSTPTRTGARDPFATQRAPTWGPTVAPQRDAGDPFRPSPRTPSGSTRLPTVQERGMPATRPSAPSAPSRSPGWSAPSRSTPSRTAPAPTRSSPSRSWPSPSRSAPSRTSPSPSRSMPSRTSPSPSRSMPSRTSPSPSRSMPSRSAPSRSAPSRSAPTRSAPSRSGPSRSSSPRRR